MAASRDAEDSGGPDCQPPIGDVDRFTSAVMAEAWRPDSGVGQAAPQTLTTRRTRSEPSPVVKDVGDTGPQGSLASPNACRAAADPIRVHENADQRPPGSMTIVCTLVSRAKSVVSPISNAVDKACCAHC